MGIYAGCVDGVIGPFMDCVKKPVDTLFLCGWVGRVVVGHLATDLFKKINMLCYVRTIHMS